MIYNIEYKSRNLKGAYLYVPEAVIGPLPLVVWLTGGNDGAQLPLRFSLGKMLDEGKLTPNCAVLMPAAGYGRNYTTMDGKELVNLIDWAATKARFDTGNMNICGWSLGADAAAILTNDIPMFFARVCLISNYPKEWDGKEPVEDYRILVGAREKSAKRDWGIYPVERIDGYGHEIGDRIWADEKNSPLDWLIGKEKTE